jgi:hypothetical protein
MREIVRNALWSLQYHQQESEAASRRLLLARELEQKCGYEPIDDSTALDLAYLIDEGETAISTTPHMLMQALVGDAMHSVNYHQEETAKAQTHLNVVKRLLWRCKMPEVTIENVTALIKEEEEKRKATA